MDGEKVLKVAVIVVVFYIVYRLAGGLLLGSGSRYGGGDYYGGSRQQWLDRRQLTTPASYVNWGAWAPGGAGFGGFGFGYGGIPIYGDPGAYGPGYSHPSGGPRRHHGGGGR